MKFSSAWVIFMLGTVPLVFLYYPLKEALPPYGVVAVAVGYLLALRLFSEFLAERLRRRRDDDTR